MRGLQALKFVFDYRPRVTHLGEHLRNLRRVGLIKRASPLQDHGPRAPHEQKPVSLGQNALRRVEHLAEIITDQLLGGKVGRAAHAPIIPRKRAIVEPHTQAERRLNGTRTRKKGGPGLPGPR